MVVEEHIFEEDMDLNNDLSILLFLFLFRTQFDHVLDPADDAVHSQSYPYLTSDHAHTGLLHICNNPSHFVRNTFHRDMIDTVDLVPNLVVQENTILSYLRDYSTVVEGGVEEAKEP